jgi:hypothetical protein
MSTLLTKELNIYIISDSIGETAEHVVKAAISQFNIYDYEVKKIPYVLEVDTIKEALDEASKDNNCIVFYTLVDQKLVNYFKNYSTDLNLLTVDLMSPIINAISSFIGMEPIREPGANRRLDESYYRRVDAVEFAVKYDDGQDPRGVYEADIVLIGISRTSKTPLSMYLANKMYKVANIPLVPETKVPKEIFEIPARRIIGLTNSPMKLNEIREERLKAMGLPKSSSYASMERILNEIDYAEAIMKKIGCPIIDVSNKAVEETAEIIINQLKKYKNTTI